MTNYLLPSNSAEFLTRFQNFYDGLVRCVYITFTRQRDRTFRGVPRGVVVTCSVLDRIAPEDEIWVNLTLDAEEVSELILIEGKTTSVVLSSGLSIGFYDGRTYLAIDAEAQSLDEFREADFLIVCARCSWAVSPYNDKDE